MNFKFKKTPIRGLIVVEPEVFKDERGECSENYKASEFRKAGINDIFVQENRSISCKGVLRGFRYQRAPHAQARLVRCGRGEIFEAAVDLRPRSRTYGTAYSLRLSEANGRMLYMPPGFAHAFLALTDEAEVVYKCSKEYAPAYEGGFRWNDPALKIKWPVKYPKVSVKDAWLPGLWEQLQKR